MADMGRRFGSGLDLGKAMEFERALDGIFHWHEYDDRSSELYHWKRHLKRHMQ